MELKELNWCVNMWKYSEAAKQVFQWIFVLNSAKQNSVSLRYIDFILQRYLSFCFTSFQKLKLFLFHVRGWRCLFHLNGVLFPQEIWNEKILLCIVITWKLKAEKIKWFYHETWRYKLLKKSNKYYSKFDSLKKWLLTFNHSAPNCMKTLLIIFSPKVTS